jgi:hypothetical protein
MSSRVRQKSSAVAPSMWSSPSGRDRPETGSLTLNGTQTFTPFKSSMTFANPARPISMKWSMWIPVCCSTVFHRHDAPPAA